MRRYVIAGNWKMNMTPSAARKFVTELAPKVAGKARFRFAEETAAIPKGAILPKTKVFEAAKQSTAQTVMLKISGAAVLSIFGIFSEKDFVLTSVIL